MPGQALLPVAFESKGCTGERFLHFFNQMVQKIVDEVAASVAAIAIYWSRRLELTLQLNMAQVINFRLMILYAGLVGFAAAEETV